MPVQDNSLSTQENKRTSEFVVVSPEGEEEDLFPEDFEDYFPSTALSEQVPDKVSVERKREDIRGRLAVIYTIATFVMFGLGFVVAVLDAAWRQVSIVENLSSILPLLSGIFLGTLGFVLGYYFRREEENPSPTANPEDL